MILKDIDFQIFSRNDFPVAILLCQSYGDLAPQKNFPNDKMLEMQENPG